MGILEQLGLNHTYFIQFAVFVFALLILSQFVFKDFLALYERRENETTGTEGLALEEIQKAKALSENYESVARNINGQIKEIFDTYREEASAEYQKIVSRARLEATRLIEENRSRVTVELGEATQKLQSELPALAQAVVKKLVDPASGRAS